MTVSTQVNKINHLGNGVSVSFAYNFLVLDETHMYVLFDDVDQDTGWIMSGVGDANGGQVVFAEPPADVVAVTLIRIVPMTQEIDYKNFEPFPVDTHERGFDKLTQMIQQLQEQAVRSINLPVSDDGTTSIVFPAYSPGDNIGWDESGKFLVNIPQIVCPAPYVDPYNELTGRITAEGAILKGSGGYTLNLLGLGNMQIVFDTPITQDYVVVVSISGFGTQEGWGANVYTVEEVTTSFTIETATDNNGTVTSRDWAFHLVWQT